MQIRKLHALLHACNVFNILPLKDLVTAYGTVSTPFELFVGSKPMVSHFRVFGCPCIAKKWTVSGDGKPENNSKGNQRGIRGIYLGFYTTQKGLLLYVLSTRQIVICGDVICDEAFASIVALTWRPFHDALALRPTSSFIPDPYTVLEYTRDLLPQFEEGNATANSDQTATTSPFEEDIIHSDLISDPGQDSSEKKATEGLEDSKEEAGSSEAVPQIVDDGLDSNTRRSNRTRNPPKPLSFKDFQAAWQEIANNVSNMELFTACQAEVKEPPINLNAVDPSSFMPPPMGIRLDLKMSDKKFREAWLRAYQKEIKTLIDAKAFALDKPRDGEPVIPTMETNKVKIKSDGSLEKLKCRIVVRGDLQDTGMENSWSPKAPFRSLKMFLADAARNRCTVHQLDFVGAFLQANVRGRIFVTLPKVYGDIWPEFKEYSGRPLRLVKSMHGMTYSGKYWYLDLKEWLVEEEFTQSRASPCIFCKVFPDGSYVKLIFCCSLGIMMLPS